MNLREQREELEKIMLASPASWSVNSRGRDIPEEPCDIRTCYQRDRDRILHCKSFRRMKHKTQVFISPEGDHYRTRLTHTLEVSQIARTIGRALRLNEDLIEAIALSHDLGHAPFGHAGERVLNECNPHGFAHNEQSVRVVEKLEDRGRGHARGLNLTWEVRDGILNHSMSRMPSTAEGKVVRYADKIAYINHDIDDAIRGQVITEEDLPRELLEILGFTFQERIDHLIHDVIQNSMQAGDVCMSGITERAMRDLRTAMFHSVYIGSEAKKEEGKAEALVRSLYRKMKEKPELLPQEYLDSMAAGEDEDTVICDYISSMSDNYAMRIYEALFVPKGWSIV